MAADPVMAVVRVTAPADVDPYVLEAELTRAIWQRSMSAELALLPSARRAKGGRLRQHGFVAVLCTANPRREQELTGDTEKALRKALRRRFGPGATAKVRLARSDDEVETAWCSVRGTPHRP
jgi:hypothetical protein